MTPLQHMETALERARQGAIDRNDQQLLAAMGQLRQAIIALGMTLRPAAPPAPALRQAFTVMVYPLLCAAYQAVGQPCGAGDAAMLRWLRQQAAIAAEAERRQQERRWQRGCAALQALILEAGAAPSAGPASSIGRAPVTPEAQRTAAWLADCWRHGAIVDDAGEALAPASDQLVNRFETSDAPPHDERS